MNIKRTMLAIAGALIAASCLAAKDDVAARDLIECNPRKGLPNFFAKAERGSDIKVGYLGGSITAQHGWRVRSLDLFRKLYPKSNFSEVNAAIGGTGSNFGVMRVQKDIIESKPDLVFVEFAVNDHGGGKEYIEKNMEGIVRQIWTDNPNADICFVYTIVERDIDVMKDGKMKRTSSIMEGLADHYGIPSIDFGKAVVDLVKAGKLVMKTDNKPMSAVAGDSLNTTAAIGSDGKIPFAKDGVHPHTNTGHVIYTEAIERSIPAMRKASGAPAPHVLGPKMSPNAPDKISAVRTVELDSLKDFPRDEKDKSAWSQYLRLEPGDEITLKFRGTEAAACVRLGTDSGYMEFSVDGGKFRKVRNFDPYCGWNRRSMTTLCSGLKDGVHTVVIRALGDKFDKKAILFKQHHADFEKNPQKFAPTRTYISAFFINGDFISAEKTATAK